MRSILLSVLSFIVCMASFAQKISYRIPDDYENDISQQDYKRIVDLAVPIVAKKYAIESIKEGTINLKKGQDLSALNLHNLILRCIEIKNKSAWGKVIQDHFNRLFGDLETQRTINPNDFESIRQYLSIRIYPAEMIQTNGGPSLFVYKTDLSGTYTLLMLDLPNSFIPVEKKIADVWKKSEAELFSIAIANINKQPMTKETKVIPFEGNKFEISFIENENYAASYALDVSNNSAGFIGEWGSVVSIPNKGIANFYKLNKDNAVGFVKYIQMMKPVTEQFYAQHQQPVSDQFFWYYKGKFTKIMVQVDNRGIINVIPPLGLSELMTSKK
ncbi:hypothetical protein [Emticicia agri]|uniref:Uncharacterized protein n=1 Tax=Emticicia agri TaxID=2492393 RepID=A0A4V1ZCK2_9BACT|nr:hypothetical protein [Emticicia agri]RYU92950.1 hypothetical protein EWM59_24535 [Emticicia agri]